MKLWEVRSRVNELREMLDAHKVCCCDLCIERQKELDALQEVLDTHEREPDNLDLHLTEY